MRALRTVLASIVVANAAGVASAQFDRAREAVAQVEVVDEACHQAQLIFRKKIPLEEKEAELRKLRIQQDFRLLVSGVAVSSQEVVTRALHPRARLRIMVKFRNSEWMKADVIGNDPRSNLALLRTPKPAPAFVDPVESPVVAAQPTFLIGYRGDDALEAPARVTHVSIGASCKDIYGVRRGAALDIGSVFVVATTGRRVNPGGACLDAEGRLIGVLLGCAPPQAMPGKAGPLADMERSFVIPGRRIVKVIDALRRHGRVVRAEFGLRVAPVSECLRAHLPEVPSGAGTIERIEDDGPAAKAGLRRNDILLSVNDQSPADVHQLRECLHDCEPKKPAKLRVLRSGKDREISVTPTELDAE